MSPETSVEIGVEEKSQKIKKRLFGVFTTAAVPPMTGDRRIVAPSTTLFSDGEDEIRRNLHEHNPEQEHRRGERTEHVFLERRKKREKGGCK